MNKKLTGLYAITDESLMPVNVFQSMAEAALASGAKIIQYRDKSHDAEKRIKQANELRDLCNKYNAILIINDDIELTLKSNADGIHLGKDDTSIHAARKRLGPNKIIGVSCYNKTSLAEKAIKDGVDYIAFGSFFGSSIKPDAPKADAQLIATIKKHHATPVCCIGGITTKNCGELLSEKADMLAIITELFSSQNTLDIQKKCTEFLNAFNNT